MHEMETSEALKIFGLTHTSIAHLTAKDLATRWKSLIRDVHPDNPDNQTRTHEAGNINAAYDALKKFKLDGIQVGSSRVGGESRYRWAPPPAWETDPRASYSAINRHDFSDINYFKQQMWERSGGSGQKYHIDAFDGYFFRGSLTVFGSPQIFRSMADAMRIWNGSGCAYNTRAVFVSVDSTPNKLFLIYADEVYYNPPVAFEHDSFNANASNDQNFVRRLPGILDEMQLQKTSGLRRIKSAMAM
jgi:hypothetical protein